MAQGSDWELWIDSARSADILGVARSLGATLRKSGTAEFEGPCPICGGTDRFSVNVKKQVCNCRKCGLTGNVIAFVQGVTGGSFIESVEQINGTPRPDRSRDETLEDRNARLAMNARRQADYQRREEEQRQIEAAKAKRDEEAIAAVLDRAVPLAGTFGEAYVKGRGLTPHKRLTGDIKFVPDLDYWGAKDNGTMSVVHLATLPAIIAIIRDFSGAIIGISQTYLDPKEPRKWRPEGSPTNSNKKIRGEKKHGMIRLGRPGETLAIAEGWENTLAWHQLGHGTEDVALVAAVDLGNLAGKSTGEIELACFKDEDGKPLRVSNGEPAPKGAGVVFPEGVKSIIILCDNDSEPIATIAKLRCAVNRYQAEGLEVALFWPPPGADWNDVLLYETKRTPLPEDTKATEETKKFRYPGGRETGQEFLARTEPIFSQSTWLGRKPIVAELKPIPAFDAKTLLPEPLRKWILDESWRMPCPPDFIAAAVVVALGSIVGARCAIKPKAHDLWLIVPNLWGGIVGDPAAKKSPACAAALKPLDPLIAKAHEEHSAALRDYDTEKVIFDAQYEAIQTRIRDAAKKPTKGDPLTIARELKPLRDQAPKKPTPRRYKTNDSTVEKLGELLRENQAGILVERDELVGLVSTWDREGREGERAFFLEAWNGNQSFDVDRIGRGHIRIANVCVSIFGGIQPDKLTMYLELAANSLANDGMLQRFQVLVYPDAQPWEWRDRPPNKEARNRVFAVFERLSEFDPLKWGAAPADDSSKFPHFLFSDEAQRVFIEWSEDLHQERIPKEDDPIIRQHLSKFDKLFPALALIFHLVDCAAREFGGPVTKEAALRAAAWCEYLEAHARRCYGLLKDGGLRAAQALAKKLERGAALPDGFTARDVRRNQWRNLTTDDAVQAALDWLEDEGWISWRGHRGNRPRHRSPHDPLSRPS